MTSLSNDVRQRRIVILGATGSIGRQTLSVCEELGAEFQVVGLAAGRNWQGLGELARETGVHELALEDARAVDRLRAEGPEFTVRAGSKGIVEMVEAVRPDIVVVAIAGLAALEPMLAALRLGARVAFASKEPLVAAGKIVIECARRYTAELVPIDSEISAVFQCLQGVRREAVEEIILTASGGPFVNATAEELMEVTPEQALAHPTWRMGPKVTIDSATLMNKGFEVFELHWLFGVPVRRIRVVVHHQSIIHSAVQLVDSSIIAQMGMPDMRAPIQYALTYPERRENRLERLNLAAVGRLTFAEPDTRRFPCLSLAYHAAEAGGTYPAALNAADEVAVEAFLAGDIRFTDIPVVLERVLEAHQPQADHILDHVIAADRWAREAAAGIVREIAADR